MVHPGVLYIFERQWGLPNVAGPAGTYPLTLLSLSMGLHTRTSHLGTEV